LHPFFALGLLNQAYIDEGLLLHPEQLFAQKDPESLHTGRQIVNQL
jgi:hypothetical protein